MPLFARFKNKGAQATSKGKHGGDSGNGNLAPPQPARWQSRWESTLIVPDEIKELVHVCTAEMKSRAEALDAPFLLLPFRPDSDPQGARTFVRNFYKANAERSSQYKGEGLKQELRLTDSVVLCSILKWCWSRMPNGVVSWPVYEGFRIGESEADMARNAFDTFVPIGADSDARKSIIFDFFDALAAVAAHGKMNGLTGRKLSRLAGWWAFDHSDEGNGFEGGYRSWTAAADASSHLFFAYLRSQSPDTDPSMNVIERIPRSLQALVGSTEYPPQTPTLLQRSTPRVVMLVDSVSPTPFALLRRAKHFEYRDQDRILREFQEFEDPIDALTEECKRVLFAVSSANQSTVARSRQGLAKPDESWTAFQSMGFADIDEKSLAKKSQPADSNKTVGQGLRDTPRSRNADAGRPTTPSWADFLSSGFADDGSAKSPTLLYPPEHVLPPLGSRSSSPGPLPGDDDNLAPGELAAITNVELDDAFWWVWMTSLAGEEPTDRKGVFGRCALVETSIMNGRWLIMEEQVKGASPDPAEGAYIAPKKSFFATFTKKSRLGRRRSMNKRPSDGPERLLSATPSKTSISTDREAKIKAAARALTRKQDAPDADAVRRGRIEDAQSAKTNSMLTIGLQSEAGPAMKWASSYDKNTIRAQYLGDNNAGKGMSRENLARNSVQTNGDLNGSALASPTKSEANNRELPAVPSSPVSVPVSSVRDFTGSPQKVEETKSVDEPSLDTAALDKELAVSPPASPGMSRKPLPRQNDHPAYRTVSKEEQKPQTPSSPTALAAAQMAMQGGSPESQRSIPSRKPVGGQAGIKKLFGKKIEGGRDSIEAPRPVNKGLVPPESGVSRRLSMLRKKASNSNGPRAGQAAAAAAYQPTYVPNHSSANVSQTSTLDREAAEREFSRFDQGPMDDMPSAMPTDSVEPSPEPNHHVFDKRIAQKPQPQPQTEPEEDFAPAPDVPTRKVSAAAMEDYHDSEIVQDRWATIRDNAHKRAARQHEAVSEPEQEDQSVQSRPSHSLRTDDDGETSGEETIESRVARIKARVAELTGNMDAARA